MTSMPFNQRGIGRRGWLRTVSVLADVPAAKVYVC